jgi:hypothetical protein
MKTEFKDIHELITMVFEGKTHETKESLDRFHKLFGDYAIGQNASILLRDGRASLTPLGQAKIFDAFSKGDEDAIKTIHYLREKVLKEKDIKKEQNQVIDGIPA